MHSTYSKFLEDTSIKAFDLRHRETMAYNMLRYDEAVVHGKEQFAHLELAKRRAGMLKHHVLENLESQIKTFEQHFSRNGGKVVYAENAIEAKKAVFDILQQNNARLVVKSKTMITEEIGLGSFLEKQQIEYIETDLGEFILQLSHEKPYHHVTPIMHLTAREVAEILHAKFGLSLATGTAEMADFIRKYIREKVSMADAGITGANFIISGTGAVAVTENEGNAALSMAIPRIHIILAGIEQMIESLESLDLFWPLLASHATGQHVTAYNTIIHGPRAQGENDGPEQVYVVLIDNGRSQLLAATPQRRALACIGCGACLNACPVYRNIGGHAYGTTYSGPIGAVISPFLSGNFDEYKHLSFASSLCGKCTEVCPVGIDLHHQLIRNRNLAVKSGYTIRSERWLMWLYKTGMKKRRSMDWLSPKKKNSLFKKFMAEAWGDRREMPKFVKSFASNRARLRKL